MDCDTETEQGEGVFKNEDNHGKEEVIVSVGEAVIYHI